MAWGSFKIGKIPLLFASLAEKSREVFAEHGTGAAGTAAAGAAAVAAHGMIVPAVVALPAVMEYFSRRAEERPRPEALIELYRKSLLEALESCAKPLETDSRFIEDEAILNLWKEGLRVSAEDGQDPHWKRLLDEEVPQAALEGLSIDPGNPGSFWPIIRLQLARWTDWFRVRRSLGSRPLGLNIPRTELHLSPFLETYLAANLPRELLERFLAEITSREEEPAFRQASLELWNSLTARLHEISELVGHGLISPEAFRFSYWRSRRSDPGLELLWSDSERASVVAGSLAGRDAEINDFRNFLANRSAWVQFWRGWPGTGKSRLMIEFAECATDLGYRVFFVSSDVKDLHAALLRLGSLNPVLLIWDDYQGQNPDAMRTFLDLQTLPADPYGPVLKRVVTGWPTMNVLGEKARDRRYLERELTGVVPETDLIEHTRRLLPTLTANEAGQVVRIAQSHPEAVLRGAVLLLQGRTVDQLPPNLLEDAYDNLIDRLMPEERIAERRVLGQALLALALTGSVDLGSEHQLKAFENAGVTEETVGLLAKRRTASRQGEVYSLGLDSFRAHVIRRCLDHRNADVMAGSPRQLAQFAQPLLSTWIGAIWGMCALAVRGTGHENDLYAAMLAAIDKTLRTLPPVDEFQFAAGLVIAGAVESDARRREALAERIGHIRERHDTPDIGLQQAMALFNITAVETDARRCEALAERIGHIRERHDTPDIALHQARALYNATPRETDARRREALAERIGHIRERHDTRDIALHQARALYNATPRETDGRRCEALAERIGHIRERHDTPDIALHQARALYNATPRETDGRRCEALAERIGHIRERHDTPEIALQQAMALLNATVGETDGRRREALAERIGHIRERHDTPEIALQQAMALVNATAVETDARRREALVGRIGQIRQRYDTLEIALYEASAL